MRGYSFFLWVFFFHRFMFGFAFIYARDWLQSNTHSLFLCFLLLLLWIYVALEWSKWTLTYRDREKICNLCVQKLHGKCCGIFHSLHDKKKCFKHIHNIFIKNLFIYWEKQIKLFFFWLNRMFLKKDFSIVE